MKYSLSKLGRQAGKTGEAYLPVIQPTLSSEMDYLKALRSLLRQVAAETRESIIPAYRVELEQKRAQAAFTGDVDRTQFQGLVQLTEALVRQSEGTVRSILDLEAARHTKNFVASAKRAIGIDISAMVSQEDLTDYMAAAVARNVSLIKSLADDTIKAIEQTVYRNAIAGNSVKTLQAELIEAFRISENRAKLIARDQIGKFNSDLNQQRQTDAGVEEYEWMTSHDERVRSRHRPLDGKRYKWGEATGAEGGLAPGQPIRCRCVARGIVVFDEAPKKKASGQAAPKPAIKPESKAKPAPKGLPKDQAQAERFLVEHGIASYGNLKGIPIARIGGMFEAARETKERFGFTPLCPGSHI